MDFDCALILLKKSYKIKRAAWVYHLVLEIEGIFSVFSENNKQLWDGHIASHDLLANDWEIVK